MDTDFEREQRWWDAKAAREEADTADEAVNRTLRWREIDRRLDGVRTVLDVGGGTGAFSLPLTRRGFVVTHLDLSEAMLRLAREKAGDLDGLTLVHGNAADLSCFGDQSFDLVLNLDGAISFCGARAEQALRETCRVARQRVIVAVAHRAWMVPITVSGSLKSTGRLLPAVETMARTGSWHQDQFPENSLLSRGCTQDYLGPLRAFLPTELRLALEAEGFVVERCGGLGSLANFCGPEALSVAQGDPILWEQFHDLCEQFDLELLPDGPGTRQRSGLLAVATRPGS